MRTWMVSLDERMTMVVCREDTGRHHVGMATSPELAAFIVDACNEKEEREEDHRRDAARYDVLLRFSGLSAEATIDDLTVTPVRDSPEERRLKELQPRA